nr:M23 family metallopeptidase [Ferrimicrobium acidiphilum]
MKPVQFSLPLRRETILGKSSSLSPAHVSPLKNSIDFFCELETPVYAAADGLVIDCKFDGARAGKTKVAEPWGNFVEVRHRDDTYSEYEHLAFSAYPLVKIGDYVKRGQLIAYTGATGWLAGLKPHLHFMVGKYNYSTVRIAWKDH